MKKFLIGIFAFVSMLGCLLISQPVAMAADAPETVTAYLTISLQDSNDNNNYSFAEANDNTRMAAKAIQVSDQDDDGALTVYDMLYCAHMQYAPGGLNDFAISSAASGSATVKKIWNVQSNFLFLNGSTMAPKTLLGDIKSGSGQVAIANGTHLYVVQNYTSKADFFSNSIQKIMSFVNDARITVYKGQEFTLCANTFDNSNPGFSPVKKVSVATSRDVYYKKAGAETGTKITTTPQTGKITTTFDETGDYLIYTVPNDGTAPAACIVHVEENRPVPESIQLGLSEDSTDLLDYASETKEYSITVPDSATTLYGRMAYASASGNLQWYSEVSTDGTTYKSVNTKGFLDGKTTGNININGAQKLKLYINDKSLQLAKNKPLSDNFIINIKRQIQLAGLTTSGFLLSDADYTTGHLDVYVSHDAQTATLTPTVKSGDTITVNNKTAASGEAFAVNLTDAETTATIIVHRDGDTYVDGTYTVTFHKAADQAAPVFIEQPASEVQEYIVGDGSAYVKPLHVFANANGTVTYQWYSNTTNSTEGGTAIADAIGATYSPATDTAGERYYYCVATNGSSTTVSTCAHVIVYAYPIQSISWSMSTPELPEDKKELFGDHTTGFYYQKGDTDVTPLTVNVTFEPHFAKLINDGKMIVSYDWGPKNNPVKTDFPSCAPSTAYAIGGQEWYCSVTIFYLDYSRNFNKSTDDVVYIHIDNADSSRPDKIDLSGDGTKASPWELSSQADLEKLREYVNGGYDFADTYLLFTKDITLNVSWESIGTGNDGTKGKGWNVFSGTLDGGGHTLTYADGSSEPLFAYVREATVQNLSIKAVDFKNYALVSNYAVDYGDDGNYSVGSGGSYAPGCPDTIDIINVTIESGSSIEKGGFLGGFASGANTVNIRNCVVKSGVTIGTNGSGNIGSFAGCFSGTITNCVSYADIVGKDFVGGIVGQKGQSMGLYEITNCAFLGTVNATGKYVGGIAGGGYTASSAPNTPGATIQNCYVSGNVAGADCVGGIFGGEASQLQAWNDAKITDNCFYGKVSADGEDASCGGIIGSLKSLNKHNIIENNYYVEDCGAEKGIGNVSYLDTSCENPAHSDNCTVFNSAETLPEIRGIQFTDQNRADDPLGADTDKLAAKKTAAEFTDNTVVGLLNISETSWKNWTQGTNGPVFSAEPVFYKLEVSGSYKTKYTPGEELDLTGIAFTAYRSDGYTKKLTLDDVTALTTFDPNSLGEQTLKFQYGGGVATIKVSVIKNYTDDDRANFGEATVYFTITDDSEFVIDYEENAIAARPTKVRYFDLASYGLEKFYLKDNDGNIIERPTVLHLLITALEKYYLNVDESECGQGQLANSSYFSTLITISESSSAGSLYMTQFWNHDENLVYFVNGEYPLQEGSENTGATADQIVLNDGDFVDLAMFTDWDFYNDENSGFRFFTDSSDNTPEKKFELIKGEDLMLTCVTAHADMNGGKATYTPVGKDVTVYYSRTMGEVNEEQKLTTDENGKILFDTDELAAGTWYIWTDAGLGKNAGDEDIVVTAPASAIVVVKTATQNVEDLIDAIGGEITLDSKETIEAARAAYEALSDEEKEQIDSEKLAALENAEDEYAALKRRHSSHGGTTNYYVVHTYINGEGTIDPCGTTSNVMVKSGKSKTFIFTPAEGYEVADVLVNNKSVGAVTSYTFTNVDHDKNLEVTFVKSANTAATSSVITDTPAVKNPNTGAGI